MIGSYEDPDVRQAIQQHLAAGERARSLAVGGAMPNPVIVADWTWHCALREMDPSPIWPDRKDIDPEAESEYPRSLVQAVVDYLSEDLSCDHSVNICMCSAIAVVDELVLNLAGRETCRDCGGEGHVWDQAAYDAAKVQREAEISKAQAGLIEWCDELWWDLTDSYGYRPCDRCNKKGTINQ